MNAISSNVEPNSERSRVTDINLALEALQPEAVTNRQMTPHRPLNIPVPWKY